MIFWSTIAFAFGGVESGSTMGEEIEDARRTVPRAILAAGAVITALYIAGDVRDAAGDAEGSGVGTAGIMQAMQAMTRAGRASAGSRRSSPRSSTLNALGGVGGWFAATARLPFVAGIDRFLPPAFGDLHPKWRTPYVALLVQAAIAALFVFLGQAGTSVRGAYDALVSMGIIALFHPVPVHVRGDDRAAARAGRPGGDARARRAAGRDRARRRSDSSSRAVSIVLACIPADEEPNKMLAVVKVVGSSASRRVGAIVYVRDARRVVNFHGEARLLHCTHSCYAPRPPPR